jgi:[acyl-carrier-protein] S-malonyltransferase
MIEMGCTQFVECGPGKVLSGLIRRIDKSKPAFCIETPDDMQTTLTQLG